MDQVAHIILTRFNVPTKGREADVRARNGWLERRFQLFDQYCLPSVSAQTVRDFRWIIYFDRATPALFRAQIRAMQGQFPFLALFRRISRLKMWLPMSAVFCRPAHSVC